MIKLLLVDDHPVVLRGLKSFLSTTGDIHVVGEAKDGETAVRLAVECQPDVVLMDVSMPGMNGIMAAKKIKVLVPRVKVLMLTMYDSPEYAKQAVKAKVNGYVLKDSTPDELVEAIKKVNDGGNYFSQRVAEKIQKPVVEPRTGRGRRKTQDLSRREIEVLENIAKGMSSAEISKKLGISLRTVETHRERMMKKLDIHNVAGLTRYAIMNGMAH